ncbi:MAG: methyltransferase domain-containing protein [Anaerolineae bacterium]|nr:methyltransferase domain-containing protein [Anaerolineae bacterium]
MSKLIQLPFHPIANLFPLLSEAELQALVTDIQHNGLLNPIWVHEERIIDGRNRYLACQRAGVTPRYQEWSGNEHADLVRFVVSQNVQRRHLTVGQRTAVAVEIERELAVAAKERQALNAAKLNEELGRKTASTNEAAFPGSSGQARDQAAAMMGVNPHYVTDGKMLQRDAPDLFERVASGELNIPEAKRELGHRRSTQQRLAALPQSGALPFSARLICGDFTQIGPMFPDGSFDVIITDPPYSREYLPLYEVLAREAQRLLKPGGSLAVMCGQTYLPEILALMTPALTYHWVLAYLTPGGQSTQIWPCKINTFWKPVLWFTNGAYAGAWIGDVARSAPNANDKDFHRWGQSESGMVDLVARLSRPGDHILDPFCGAGTTGVAALALGQRFTGIDRDWVALRTARRRLSVGG